MAGLAALESGIGLYKTELISKRGPWKMLAQVELATAEYVEWFNWVRHSVIGHIPPAEYDAASAQLIPCLWCPAASRCRSRPAGPTYEPSRTSRPRAGRGRADGGPSVW